VFCGIITFSVINNTRVDSIGTVILSINNNNSSHTMTQQTTRIHINSDNGSMYSERNVLYTTLVVKIINYGIMNKSTSIRVFCGIITFSVIDNTRVDSIGTAILFNISFFF
jgi:hypothetical protein